MQNMHEWHWYCQYGCECLKKTCNWWRFFLQLRLMLTVRWKILRKVPIIRITQRQQNLVGNENSFILLFIEIVFGADRPFKSLFSDSLIAESFSMSQTKWSYLINYGLAVYFKEKLINTVKDSPYFIISSDKSLNNILQEELQRKISKYCKGLALFCYIL